MMLKKDRKITETGTSCSLSGKLCLAPFHVRRSARDACHGSYRESMISLILPSDGLASGVIAVATSRLVCFVMLVFTLLVSNSVVAVPLPAPPQLSAKSYLLIDFDSGRVIAEKQADLQVEPASLTKMMTAYVVSAELERGSITLEDDVIVSEYAHSMPGSRMFIESGKTVKLLDLLKGLIIQSGNDASVALAEHVAASESSFAEMMNFTAEQLGMTSTNYTNASGLPDDDHYTTAADLSLLARALIRDYPEEYRLYAVKEYEFNNIPQKNRNKLLWRDDTVDGIKTGHTEAAGYCLVASSVRDNMRLISILVGAGSEKARATESQQLLNYGFRFYRTEKVYAAGEVIQEARIWMGKNPNISLGVTDDLFLTLPRGGFEGLTSQIELSDYIKAPARVGQQFGRSVLKSGDEVVGEVPLLALQRIEEGGFFQRMKDSVMRHFR